MDLAEPASVPSVSGAQMPMSFWRKRSKRNPCRQIDPGTYYAFQPRLPALWPPPQRSSQVILLITPTSTPQTWHTHYKLAVTCSATVAPSFVPSSLMQFRHYVVNREHGASHNTRLNAKVKSSFCFRVEDLNICRWEQGSTRPSQSFANIWICVLRSLLLS